MTKKNQATGAESDKVTIVLSRKAADKWLENLVFAQETLRMDANSAAVDQSLRKDYDKCANGIGSIYGAVAEALLKNRRAGMKSAISKLNPVGEPIKEHQ